MIGMWSEIIIRKLSTVYAMNSGNSNIYIQREDRITAGHTFDAFRLVNGNEFVSNRANWLQNQMTFVTSFVVIPFTG